MKEGETTFTEEDALLANKVEYRESGRVRKERKGIVSSLLR
jgi:hypothetical protein